MPDLSALYSSLLPPPLTDGGSSTRFSAVPLPSLDQHRLAKSTQGTPALLIAAADTESESRPVPIQLQHLTVQHGIACQVLHPDGRVEEKTFTIIHCTDADINLQVYFLRVVAPVVATLGAAPSRLDISRAVDSLVELFRAMTKPPRKSVQGLWAELFLIARARNPRTLISAWHAVPEDRYDFSLADQRIEVKSASGAARQHYFTLEQLHPPFGARVLIASMFVERAGAGTSIANLIDEIQLHIKENSHLVIRLDQVVGLTLGASWASAAQERFDREQAEYSLLLFKSSDVPSVHPNLPLGVSEVRFRSDLMGVSTVDLSSYGPEASLFNAAQRR